MSRRPKEAEGYITLRRPPEPPDADSLAEFLAELVESDPRNALPEGDNPPIFEAPLVGIASAADPLFETLRRPGVVGPIHRDPGWWLDGARSAISVFLPFSRPLKRSYDRRSPLPSLEWASARINGEIFVNVVRRALARHIERLGGRAAAPTLDLRFQAEKLVAMWSERHVAYIAGLGTFGLHAGLLTARGAAGRIASVVTDLDLPPTPRPYAGIYDYCIWKTEGRCGACIKRCPVQAIDGAGKDHHACQRNGDHNVRPAFRDWGYHSCGHCQTHLPCSDRIPPRKERSHRP